MARYEYSEGTSNQFWEIELEGSSFTTRWGKIGTTGQARTKSFDGPAAAQREHDALVAKKVEEGYVSTGDSATAEPAVQVLRYELGDFDANDDYVFEVAPPTADGLRFVVKSESMAARSVHVPLAALDDAAGPMRIEQDVLRAGAAEISGGTVATHTAPFLVPRRFVRELLADGASDLAIFEAPATFTRGELDEEDRELANRAGIELLRADGAESSLLVAADPSVPMLFSRTAGEPMVHWVEGALRGWPKEKAGKKAKPAKAKTSKGTSGEEGLIETLRTGDDQRKRVLAAKKLATLTTPTASRALLDVAWTDTDPEVRMHAANARGSREAMIAMLEELLAGPGTLSEIFRRETTENTMQWGTRTIRVNRIEALVVKLDESALADHPDILEKIDAIACEVEEPEALRLRSVLTSGGWRRRRVLERAVRDLASSDTTQAEVARSALYALFRIDDPAAAAAAAPLVGDLSTDAQRAIATFLVSGFATPLTASWMTFTVPIFQRVPEARSALGRAWAGSLYPAWGVPPDRVALLAGVGGSASETWQEVLASLVAIDSTLWDRLGPEELLEATLDGPLLAVFVKNDVMGQFPLEGERLVAAFRRAPTERAVAIARDVLAGVQSETFRVESLWDYVRVRRDDALAPIAREIAAIYANLPVYSQVPETLAAMQAWPS